MPHRDWWPRAQHSTADVAMGKTTNCVDIPESLLLPAHKAAICSSATVDLAQRSSTPGSVSLSPSRTTLVPEEDGAGTLDWQTSLLQKVLPRPKTADLVQPTIATASHSQQQRTPSKQLRSPAVEPAHIHDSTSADQLRSSSLISTTQSHSLSSALQPEQQSSTLGKVQLPALHYAAIFLDPLSRAKLLSWAQPMHSCLTADHMTLLFRPSLEDAENLPLGTTVELSVLAKMHDSVTQAVSVFAPAWAVKQLERPPHVTVSTARGVRAKQAGDLVKKVQQGHIYGIMHESCATGLRLTGRVGVVLDGGSVAYDVDLLHTAPATSTVASSSSAIPSPYSAVPTDGRWSDAVSSSGMQRSPFTAAPSSLSVSQSLSSTKGTITQPFNTLAVESLLLPTTANGVSSTNRVSTAAARDTACMSSQQSGFTHMQTAAMQPARVSQRGVRLPVAQQVSTLSGSAGDETDVDFDDALQALQELEALEAPAELSRHSTAQGASRLQHISRPQHELCNPGSLGNHTAATHTSGAVEQDFSRQPAASDWTSQSFDRHMPQSTRSNRTVRRLWVPPGTDALPSPAAATPAAAAPVRIMKRPSTASNQNTHADASPGTSNPVLVASQLNSVPPEIIRSSSTAAIPEDPDRLQTAGAASVIRMSPPEVCPTDMKPKWQSHTRQQEVGRGNNCDSVSDNLREGFALEMAVQHLMSKTVGLSEAAAVLALKASQGDIDQALLLVHKHADLLLQPGFNDNSPSGQAQSSPAPQELSHARNLPVTAHRHQTTSAISKALDVGHLPTPVKPLLPAGVSLPIPLQISPPAVNNREHLSAFSRHGSAALQATEMGQLPTTVKQLLPAGVSLPTPLLSSPPAVNSKEHLSALSKRGSGVLHAAEVGTAEADRKLTYSSMGSDDSNNEAQEQSLQWLSGHDAVPESVDAALAAASKVLQERGRIRDAADQERQTLTLHTQARDVYFEAAQRAYERGDKEVAQELAGKGKEHAQLAKEARTKANQAAYDSSNLTVANRFKVDLHGMHVEEALNVLENHLLNLGGLGCPSGILLQVVTGVGKHSMNGRPKILPAVVRYLSDAGYRFLEARGNPGVIDVTIGGRHAAIT